MNMYVVTTSTEFAASPGAVLIDTSVSKDDATPGSRNRMEAIESAYEEVGKALEVVKYADRNDVRVVWSAIEELAEFLTSAAREEIIR